MILLYTVDYNYLNELKHSKEFEEIQNIKGLDIPIKLVDFEIIDIKDKGKLKEQQKQSELNIVVLDKYSITLDFIMRILSNNLNTSKTIVYLKINRDGFVINTHDSIIIMELLRNCFYNAHWVRNDFECLCQIIKEELKSKKHNEVEENLYVDKDNILNFDKYLQTEFKEDYLTGVCLLSQSQYLLSKLKNKK